MKILLAVDGSKYSQTAAALLPRVASRRTHHVTVLNVTPPVIPAPGGAHSITRALKDSGEKMAASYVQELGRKRSLKAHPALVESNDAAGAILDRAVKEKSELIVLGARGLTSLKTFLLGSVSQNVSRHAGASVLIVRAPRSRGALKVMAAVDGSVESNRALKFLTRLGLPRNTRMTLVSVAAYPSLLWTQMEGFPVSPGSSEITREAISILRAQAKQVLSEGKKILAPRFGRVQTHLAEGHPAGELLKFSKKSSADLIVMGRRGLSRLDRFLMGSISQKVSVYAQGTVMIVP